MQRRFESRWLILDVSLLGPCLSFPTCQQGGVTLANLRKDYRSRGFTNALPVELFLREVPSATVCEQM